MNWPILYSKIARENLEILESRLLLGRSTGDKMCTRVRTKTATFPFQPTCRESAPLGLRQNTAKEKKSIRPISTVANASVYDSLDLKYAVTLLTTTIFNGKQHLV